MAYIPNFKEKRTTPPPKQSGQNAPGRRSDPFYHKESWKKASAAHKLQEPYCRQCKANGLVILGTITDHIIPISKEGSKFDSRNHQTLCDTCHNRKRQEERWGKVPPHTLNEFGEKIPQC